MNEREPQQFPPIDPIRSGVAGRCPRCGSGKLFDGYLSLDKSCSRCGLDYGFADAGDGPAVFVILLIGFLVVGLALWVETSYGPPIWVHMVIWIPLATVLCLLLLRVLKGVLINMQYKNSAQEGEIDNG